MLQDHLALRLNQDRNEHADTDTKHTVHECVELYGLTRREEMILRCLVDGLEADIAMKGSVNLVRRDLNMEAVVAPEISATVGVAAAFAVNPIVGAAVFAASKVLGPLWSKVSILRYHISGPLDDPQINEVLRQPRKEKAQ